MSDTLNGLKQSTTTNSNQIHSRQLILLSILSEVLSKEFLLVQIFFSVSGCTFKYQLPSSLLFKNLLTYYTIHGNEARLCLLGYITHVRPVGRGDGTCASVRAAEVHLGLPCPPIMVRPLRSMICKNQAREEISIFDHHSDFTCRLIFKRDAQNCPFDVYNLIVVMVTRNVCLLIVGFLALTTHKNCSKKCKNVKYCFSCQFKKNTTQGLKHIRHYYSSSHRCMFRFIIINFNKVNNQNVYFRPFQVKLKTGQTFPIIISQTVQSGTEPKQLLYRGIFCCY